jgi:hypothetical protein
MSLSVRYALLYDTSSRKPLLQIGHLVYHWFSLMPLKGFVSKRKYPAIYGGSLLGLL